MEGFLRFSLPPWQRRMLTRLVAMVPAAIVAAVAGNRGAGKLLVLSQVKLQCHCLPSRLRAVDLASIIVASGDAVQHVVG